MKKFILMIVSVSVFFVGLGGIVKQAGAALESHLIRQTAFINPSLTIESEEKLNFENLRKPLIIKRQEVGEAGKQLRFSVRLPKPPARMVILSPEKSRNQTVQTEEIPRVENKNVIIFKRTVRQKLSESDVAKEEKKFADGNNIQSIRELEQ